MPAQSNSLSNAPLQYDDVLKFVEARMGEGCQQAAKEVLKDMWKYSTGTHPEQIKQAEEQAAKEAEIRRQEGELRKLAEAEKEKLIKQAQIGDSLDKDLLRRVEHIAHILKDDSITLHLQDELAAAGVHYDPRKNSRKSVVTTAEPIDFVSALEAERKKTEAA